MQTVIGKKKKKDCVLKAIERCQVECKLLEREGLSVLLAVVYPEPGTMLST